MQENNNMTLSEELVWRGMVNQTTLSDITFLDTNPIVFYHGFDASAPSQTVGNLAAMMVDLVFLRHGHKAIILAGGATSLIGDPGGRDAERPMQTIETISGNVEKAKSQIQNIYTGYDFELVNNIDWVSSLSIIEFLRDTGKYFNVGEMIKKEYISTRIGGEGISFTEFSYALLQGYDFLHLYQTYNCTLQIGGSDQWANCLSGVELVRKKLGKEVHCLTLPLIINKATGKKFGKSETGAIWLDEERTSVFDFYQFWLNVDDDSVKEYIKIFTPITKSDYIELMTSFEKDYSSRLAQKYLAFCVTTLVHGKDKAEKAKLTTEALFGKNIDIETADIPVFSASKYTQKSSFDLVSFLTESAILKSKREARDLIDSKGIILNDTVIEKYEIDSTLLKDKNILRVGKKRHYRILT